MGDEDLREANRSEEAQWYALYMKHHHEKKAASLLERKGIEVFLPLYKAVHRWKDRKKAVSLPLFPGYMFLRSDLRNKTEILNTPGVFFLVENAGRASPVPEHEVEAVRAVVTSKVSYEPHIFLQSGEFVQIRSGPLAGVQGFFVRSKNQQRVVVSVEVLHKAVSVEVDITNVQKIGVVETGRELLRAGN
jgi:transcription elongation factor/antiterminator RfaH